ncbi:MULTISPECIES: flagellar protein FlaG [Uliginosibacterium]|uniref:Flagellar protein FlaG n=1 Tax=Uliginosibacterium aquaticum TaxID=2731212 RepID=A0ABX2IMC3_9RHOO|nr:MULTISPECIES: flagellar protein FlaG [Uliginosibacterium]MDO6385105.1 flagellar protein FlaG [Uliginosibacterium sp. 31-12]NSL55180.1 flagellar protein FlaG [Uliginosibacterium aquaticum]PLK48782.1 flagellar protein [Uliginosibacterium sp. TH139]
MTMQPITPVSSPDAVSHARDIRPSAGKDVPLDETLNVVGEDKTEQGTSAPPPSREAVNEAMQEMQRALPSVARNLQFSIDEQTGRSVVKVVDADTSEVIRQLPSEELLNIAHALDKLSGLLLKQKV